LFWLSAEPEAIVIRRTSSLSEQNQGNRIKTFLAQGRVVSIPKAPILAFCDSILAFCDSVLAFCDSVLTFCDSVLAFCDSVLAFCDNVLAFYDNVLAFCDSILAFCDSVLTKSDKMAVVRLVFVEPDFGTVALEQNSNSTITHTITL
jgi:hypothetical protein